MSSLGKTIAARHSAAPAQRGSVPSAQEAASGTTARAAKSAASSVRSWLTSGGEEVVLLDTTNLIIGDEPPRPATWVHPKTKEVYTFLGQGSTAFAYERGGKVLKVARPWSWYMPVRDDARRATLMQTSAAFIEMLRESPEFAQFRHLLPRTELLDEFTIEQDKQGGRRLRDFDSDPVACARANAQLNEVEAAAKAAIPGVQWDLPGNLRFDDEGNILEADPTGWFDVVNPWWAIAANRRTPSPRSQQRTELRITNAGSKVLSVEWIDFNGEARPYRVIRPGETFRQDTFVGHQWHVTVLDGDKKRAWFAFAAQPLRGR